MLQEIYRFLRKYFLVAGAPGSRKNSRIPAASIESGNINFMGIALRMVFDVVASYPCNPAFFSIFFSNPPPPIFSLLLPLVPLH